MTVRFAQRGAAGRSPAFFFESAPGRSINIQEFVAGQQNAGERGPGAGGCVYIVGAGGGQLLAVVLKELLAGGDLLGVGFAREK